MKGCQRTSARNFSAFRRCCFVLRAGTAALFLTVSVSGSRSDSAGSSPGLSISIPRTIPSPYAFRALRMRAFVASSASASFTRRSSASCAARRSVVWAASGGLYDVPACGAGTAGRAMAARGCGTSGACVRGVRDEEYCQSASGGAHTLTLASAFGAASADHTSYCPLFFTASETSRRALPAPGCEGSTRLFSGPRRSFRAIRSNRSLSREFTRDLRGRA
jgi:hypothetical protein